ncbi:methyltransferase domain-containing protein [Halorussus salinus]|uniref:methyltransferase domain-containing protein n=1 Tax=Halorussus salinus TaxID=1364935 RepID=UPI001092A3A7|nr:class I SAM-dependent methyltransferase [Halorussus salinus]
MGDPFGRAVRDHSRGERDEPLIQRDGEETREHPIEQFYFTEFTAESDPGRWLESYLDGPLLDLGAGAGRHALYFQEKFETVALEVSENLVATMRDRGVADARDGDMFALRETFERDRFRSALAIGTQLGLAGSMDGLRRFLSDLAHVTAPDGTAVVDCYDPGRIEEGDLLGYRPDPTPGQAARVMTFEYEDELGETLLFRLFGPDRIREAAVGTDWRVADVYYGDEGPHYRAALDKA